MSNLFKVLNGSSFRNERPTDSVNDDAWDDEFDLAYPVLPLESLAATYKQALNADMPVSVRCYLEALRAAKSPHYADIVQVMNMLASGIMQNSATLQIDIVTSDSEEYEFYFSVSSGGHGSLVLPRREQWGIDCRSYIWKWYALYHNKFGASAVKVSTISRSYFESARAA